MGMINKDWLAAFAQAAAAAAIEATGTLMDTATCDELTAGVAAAIERAFAETVV